MRRLRRESSTPPSGSVKRKPRLDVMRTTSPPRLAELSQIVEQTGDKDGDVETVIGAKVEEVEIKIDEDRDKMEELMVKIDELIQKTEEYGANISRVGRSGRTTLHFRK